MRANIELTKLAHGHLIGSRSSAMSLRDQVEDALSQRQDVVFDFTNVRVTQSFVDELIGRVVLQKGPDVLQHMVFKSCSDDVRAIIEFVVSDRVDQYIKTHSH